MAFLRGQIQDPNLKKWWDQYLFVDGDFSPRLARQTILWLKDELAAAAHRAKMPRVVGILRRDPSRMEEADVPALDEFARRYPDGFYTDRELEELWRSEYGHGTGRQRLIQRQLAILRELEPLVATQPALEDEIAGWLDEKLAVHLGRAGIRTLGDLVDRINGKGRRWWSGIRHVGQVGGDRILRWVQENAPALGIELGQHVHVPITAVDAEALQKSRPKSTGIVPLESFLVPEDWNGVNGLFRRRDIPCLIAANDDYEAINAWIATQTSHHTRRSYRKEAERILLWSILVRQKALSSLDHDDCLAYRDFLRDPQPREQWCAPRGRRRFGPLWRPFEGPLAPAAEAHALTVLGALWQFLVAKNYLIGNPWAGIKPVQPTKHSAARARAFTKKQWAFIQYMLSQQDASGAGLRLLFVVNFAYATGMRLSELVKAKVTDLKRLEFSDGEQGWVIGVIGKRSKWREIPVPDSVMELTHEYLTARGLPADPSLCEEDTFLIGRIPATYAAGAKAQDHFDRKRGIAEGTLYDELKRFFTLCAENMRSDDPVAANRLLNASTHWLRHTFATHALNDHDNPLPLHMVQETLGHASPATTTIYVDTEIKERMRATRKFIEGKK
jgi:site-specific recombinase XerD